MTDRAKEVEAMVQKYTDYCECDEYHYGVIDGQPGNHDPADGHMEYDEDVFTAALCDLIRRAEVEARLSELKILAGECADLLPNETWRSWAYRVSGYLDERINELRGEQ